MKRSLLVSSILILTAALHAQTSAAAGPQPCASAAAAAQHIAQEWKDAYNRGDAARVAALYTSDAYYLTQHFATGIVHGRPAVEAYVQRGVDAHYKVDSIAVLFTGCSGGLAYSITRYESTNAGQKAFGVNLVVIRGSGKEWRIVAHEAAVPDPATAIQKLDIPPSR